MNIISNIASLSKAELSEFMAPLRRLCAKSAREIAIETDYSVTMVNNVFQGLNNNQTIIKAIVDNLPEGWQDSVPLKYLKIYDDEMA